MKKCQFTARYWDYERQEEIDYNCDTKEEVLDSGYCIFHDENYLQHKNNRKEHEQKVKERLLARINDSVNNKKALLCVGYCLSDITIKVDFTKPVYFNEAQFNGRAVFKNRKFSSRAYFKESILRKQQTSRDATLHMELTFMVLSFVTA